MSRLLAGIKFSYAGLEGGVQTFYYVDVDYSKMTPLYDGTGTVTYTYSDASGLYASTVGEQGKPQTSAVAYFSYFFSGIK